MTAVSARAPQPIAAEDGRIPAPDNTVWLIPDIDYDKQVITKYLLKKYSGLPRDMIQSQVNMQALPHLPDVKVVVLVRRPKEDEVLGPMVTFEFDTARNQMKPIPVPPETYVHEVVENPPVRVGDYVTVKPGQIFRPQETDIMPLVDKLCDYAHPCRVSPQCKPDFMLRCVWAG